MLLTIYIRGLDSYTNRKIKELLIKEDSIDFSFNNQSDIAFVHGFLKMLVIASEVSHRSLRKNVGIISDSES